MLQGEEIVSNFSKHSVVCFFVLSALAVGCTSNTYSAKENVSSQPTKTQYHDYGRSAVLHFTKASASITEAEKAKLRDIVAKLGRDNIKRIEIASWSDKDFPQAGPDLPKVDRDLADERATNIGSFLKESLDISFLRVRAYSMAETSNWLARMFRTDGAELKSIFAKEEESSMVRDDFNVIVNEGGPSKAVVVFILK